MSERLQKFLARAGVASRRHAEGLITAGRVTVNNERVTELGTKVEDGDLVAVDGKLVQTPETKSYYVLYKPAGVVTTMEDPQGRPTVADYVQKVGTRLFPVGRLDYDAEGALLFTDDGDIANKLTHPKYEVRRTYLAKVKGVPDEKTLEKLLMGVRLEDGMAKPLEADIFEHADRNTWLKLVVAEGRPHLIKRLCAAIGHPVVRLFRPAHGGVGVDGMKPGDVRKLSPDQVERLEKVANGEAAAFDGELKLPARRHGHGPMVPEGDAAPQGAQSWKERTERAEGGQRRAFGGKRGGFDSRRGEGSDSRGGGYRSRGEGSDSRGGGYRSRGEGSESRGGGYRSRGEGSDSRGGGYRSRGGEGESRGGGEGRSGGFRPRGGGSESRGVGFRPRGEGADSRGFKSRGGGEESGGGFESRGGGEKRGGGYAPRGGGSSSRGGSDSRGFKPRGGEEGGGGGEGRGFRPRGSGERSGGYKPRGGGEGRSGGFRPRSEGSESRGFKPRGGGSESRGGFESRRGGGEGGGGFKPRGTGGGRYGARGGSESRGGSGESGRPGGFRPRGGGKFGTPRGGGGGRRGPPRGRGPK